MNDEKPWLAGIAAGTADLAAIRATAGAILAATDMAEIVAPTVLRAYADAGVTQM